MPEAERQGDGRPPRGPCRRRAVRLLPALPPALLALLAVTQIVLVHTAHLSPWKGGGFGMFATNDHGAFRSVRAVARTPGGERVLTVPPELQRMQRRTRELPTPGRLVAFARALGAHAPEAQAVRVEVWRLVFDPDDLHPERRPLAEATWERSR